MSIILMQGGKDTEVYKYLFELILYATPTFPLDKKY